MKLGYVLLFVPDVGATIEFYERAFGQKRRFVDPTSHYGELDTGATVLGFVSHETAATNGVSYTAADPEHLPPAAEVAFVVDDVATAFEAAIAAGAVHVLPPQKKPWGQTVSYVRDCNGFLVEICSPVAAGGS